jgi:hypothetical protein
VTDADAARNAGFDAHCTKPVTTATLLELIEGASEAKSCNDDLPVRVA